MFGVLKTFYSCLVLYLWTFLKGCLAIYLWTLLNVFDHLPLDTFKGVRPYTLRVSNRVSLDILGMFDCVMLDGYKSLILYNWTISFI